MGPLGGAVGWGRWVGPMGGQTDSQVSSQAQVTRQRPISRLRVSLANRLLKQRMDVVRLAWSWIGWPNGEISTKVIASHR